jgi:hypothetical protein
MQKTFYNRQNDEFFYLNKINPDLKSLSIQYHIVYEKEFNYINKLKV